MKIKIFAISGNNINTNPKIDQKKKKPKNHTIHDFTILSPSIMSYYKHLSAKIITHVKGNKNVQVMILI